QLAQLDLYTSSAAALSTESPALSFPSLFPAFSSVLLVLEFVLPASLLVASLFPPPQAAKTNISAKRTAIKLFFIVKIPLTYIWIHSLLYPIFVDLKSLLVKIH